MDRVSTFIRHLAASKLRQPDLFNPWRDVDADNDANRRGPAIRRDNLERYLRERLQSADCLLIGEAAGYRGCHFSGIAMCSERMLLGKLEGVPADAVFKGPKQRTSSVEASASGFSEPTASIVWRGFQALGIDSRKVVIWNTLAFHPHKPDSRLSNRSPREEELAATRHHLEEFLALFRHAQAIAVGQVAGRTLAAMGHAVPVWRHPANGGASEFRRHAAAFWS